MTVSAPVLYPTTWRDYTDLKSHGLESRQWKKQPRQLAKIREDRSVYHDVACGVYYAEEKRDVPYSSDPRKSVDTLIECRRTLAVLKKRNATEVKAFACAGLMGLRAPKHVSLATATHSNPNEEMIEYRSVTATTKVEGRNLKKILGDRSRNETQRRDLAVAATCESFVLVFALHDFDRRPGNMVVNGTFGHFDFEDARDPFSPIASEDMKKACLEISRSFMGCDDILPRSLMTTRLCGTITSFEENKAAVDAEMAKVVVKNLKDGIDFVSTSTLFAGPA